MRIAVNEAGTALVSLGRPQIISIESSTNPDIIKSVVPCNHSPVESLNWANWALKITMARPFTKP